MWPSPSLAAAAPCQGPADDAPWKRTRRAKAAAALTTPPPPPPQLPASANADQASSASGNAASGTVAVTDLGSTLPRSEKQDALAAASAKNPAVAPWHRPAPVPAPPVSQQAVAPWHLTAAPQVTPQSLPMKAPPPPLQVITPPPQVPTPPWQKISPSPPINTNINFTSQVASPPPLPPPKSLPPQIGNLTNLSAASTAALGPAPITAIQDANSGAGSSLGVSVPPVTTDPVVTTASSSSSSTAPVPNDAAAAAAKLELPEYRRRLALIYEIHNPSNVPKVDYLLQKYIGREELLYCSVCKKYSVPDGWNGNTPLPGASERQQDEGVQTPASSVPACPSAGPKVASANSLSSSAVSEEASEPPEAKTEATIQQLQRELDSQTKAMVSEEDGYDPDDLSGQAAALAALQQLTGDMKDELMEEPTPEKLVAPPAKKIVVLRPPPDIPPAKGMAFIDRLLVGEKTDFFSDEEETCRIAVKEEIEEVESDGEDAKLRHEEEQALLRFQQQEKQRKVEEQKQQKQEAERKQQAQQHEELQPSEPPNQDIQKTTHEAGQMHSHETAELAKPVGVQDNEHSAEIIEDTPPQQVAQTTDPYQSYQAEQQDSPSPVQQQPTQEEQPSLVQPPPTQREQTSITEQPEQQAHESGHEQQQQQPETHDATNASEKQPAPASTAAAPSDVDQQRLAAAAAAAKGVASHAPSGSGSDSESSSDSGSDSEESSAGSQKSKGLAQTTAGPALSNGGASKASPLAGRGESTRNRAADRDNLLGAIFQDLERFCGTEGRATVKGMQRFVTMVGFDGSDNEWRAEYLSLCKEWQIEPDQGFDLATFSKMVNDQTQRGCYCSNDELRNILAKLNAAPRVAAIVSRKRRDPAPTSESVVPPSQKKPKA